MLAKGIYASKIEDVSHFFVILNFYFLTGMHVISFVRVFCTLRYKPAIYIVVGHEGPDPWDPCGGYVTKICFPRKFYKIKDVYFEMRQGFVMIKIPKKNNKPVRKIKRDFLFFREKKRIM